MFRYFFPISLSVIILIGIYFIFFKNENNFSKKQKNDRYVVQEAHKIVSFNLVDPEAAPTRIQKSVMRGYNVIMNTPFYAEKYAKGLLTCTSCHFFGGNTIGGRDNGISLVGVTQVYPQYSERSKMTIDLTQRINNCFQRSMNGHPLPVDSPIMKDILAYLDWISKEVKQLKDPPWLGLKMLKSEHKADVKNGEIVYEKYCVACHQNDGEGGGDLPEPVGKTIPPLWGGNSFNDGAGMSMPHMFAAFVFWNMPYQNSVLTEEEAIDVAAFVLSKPRPHFVLQN